MAFFTLETHFDYKQLEMKWPRTLNRFDSLTVQYFSLPWFDNLMMSFLGNLMVMISFKMDKQLQTISNYFLFSLAVADLLIGLISMPMNTIFIIKQVFFTTF